MNRRSLFPLFLLAPAMLFPVASEAVPPSGPRGPGPGRRLRIYNVKIKTPDGWKRIYTGSNYAKAHHLYRKHLSLGYQARIY